MCLNSNVCAVQLAECSPKAAHSHLRAIQCRCRRAAPAHHDSWIPRCPGGALCCVPTCTYHDVFTSVPQLAQARHHGFRERAASAWLPRWRTCMHHRVPQVRRMSISIGGADPDPHSADGSARTDDMGRPEIGSPLILSVCKLVLWAGQEVHCASASICPFALSSFITMWNL